MTKQTTSEARAEARAHRRAAEHWESVAQKDPGAAGVANGNARDAMATARAEDVAADRQEQAAPRRHLSRS